MKRLAALVVYAYAGTIRLTQVGYGTAWRIRRSFRNLGTLCIVRSRHLSPSQSANRPRSATHTEMSGPREANGLSRWGAERAVTGTPQCVRAELKISSCVPRPDRGDNYTEAVSLLRFPSLSSFLFLPIHAVVISGGVSFPQISRVHEQEATYNIRRRESSQRRQDGSRAGQADLS